MGTPISLNAKTAADLMTADPISISEDASLQDAAALMTEKGFSAVPVVDAKDRIVGVISHTDLVRAQSDPERHPAQLEAEATDVETGEHLEGTSMQWTAPERVREVMTPKVFAVWPQTLAAEVIEEMLDKKVHRLFVVDDKNVLVGVISAFDVLLRLQTGT